MNAYQGLEAEWHDLFWAEEEASELEFVEDFLSRQEGRGLYVGSGSGRLLGPLGEKGHPLLGVEVSQEMVALSQKSWPQANVICSSFEEFASEQLFGAILLPAFTFQLLEKPLQALQKMRSLVTEGGGLYLSVFFPWAELSGELPHNQWYEDRELQLANGARALLHTRHKIDEKRALLSRQHRYRLLNKSGDIEREEITRQRIQWFSDGVLEKLFQKSGWELTKEISNFGIEDEDDDLIYLVTLEARACS